MNRNPSNHTASSGAAHDLTGGPIASTLLLFSAPFMLSTLLQTLYTTTDTIVVGQYLGSNGLSAVSNGSQMMQTLYLFCVGFSTAGQIVIAQIKGANEIRRIQRVVDSLLVLEIIFSVVLGVVCGVFSGGLLRLLETPAEAFVQARYYLIICGAGMIFTGLYNMFSAVLRGTGDSIHPFLFVLIASVANIFLDILFIALFHWDVAGAAAATVIGQAISVVFSIVYINRHKDLFPFTLRIRSIRPDSRSFSQIIRLGIPTAIQTAAVQFSFLFVSRMVNTLGVTVSAAFGVAQKLRNIPGVLTQGLTLGCTAMLGQNLGAKKTERIRPILWSDVVFSTIVNAVFGIVFVLAPTLCFRAFTQDATVLAYASLGIFTIVAELPGKCVMGCGSLPNAQGFTQFTAIVGLIDAFAGRVFFCWFLGIVLDLGALGFFLGYSIGTYLTAIPMFVYFITGLWKKREKAAALV